MMRSDVVNAVLEKGSEAIVLTDGSKFGCVHPYPWARSLASIVSLRIQNFRQRSNAVRAMRGC